MAEDVRFGRTGDLKPPAVFKTAAINRSANPPIWLRRVESNYSGLATSDLQSPPAPYRTTAQFFVCLLSKNGCIIAYIIRKVKGKKIHPAVCGRQGAPLWRNEPAKNKVGTSPRRSQRNQLEFAAALASEDASVGSMVAVIFEWRQVSTTPK